MTPNFMINFQKKTRKPLELLEVLEHETPHKEHISTTKHTPGWLSAAFHCGKAAPMGCFTMVKQFFGMGHNV